MGKPESGPWGNDATHVLSYCGMSDPGKVRMKNEDAFHAGGRMFVVADGISSMMAGEKAAALAISGFRDYYSGDVVVSGDPQLQMCQQMHMAHSAIREQSVYWGGESATTVAGICFSRKRDRVYVFHTGDSRVYWWRHDQPGLRQVTADHRSPEGYVTRCVGSTADRWYPDVNWAYAQKGDHFIVCTDGLTDMVSDPGIQQILVIDQGNAEVITQHLMAVALEAGGKDNVTVITVIVE